MADKDNVYCYTDKRLLYLNDDVDNATIGKLIASMYTLYLKMTLKTRKRRILLVNQLSSTSILLVGVLLICGL